jgi:hypothetical protein
MSVYMYAKCACFTNHMRQVCNHMRQVCMLHQPHANFADQLGSEGVHDTHDVAAMLHTTLQLLMPPYIR